MRSQAEHAYPNECCGLLLGTVSSHTNVAQAVWATTNDWSEAVATTLEEDTALTQTRRYWVSPQAMLAAMRDARRRNLDIIGVYHSHPDHPAHPSECDRRLAWPQYSYLIFSVQQGVVDRFLSWRLNDNHQFEPETILPRSAPT